MSDFESRARQAADAVKSNVGAEASDSGLRRVRRSRARGAAPAALVALALVGITSVVAGGDNKGPATESPSLELASSLKPFSSCDSLLEYFRGHANDESKRYRDDLVPLAGEVNPQSRAGESAAGPATASDTAKGPEFSGTNVQEADVDEADILKTDGKRIFSADADGVHIMEANNGKPQLRATLPHPGAQGLLLSGDRLLVMTGASSKYQTKSYPPEPVGRTRQDLVLYDVSDAGSPKLLETLAIDGMYVDARLSQGHVRMAFTYSARLPRGDVRPYVEGKAPETSLDETDSRVRTSRIEDWIPTYERKGADGKVLDNGLLVDCKGLSTPSEYSGLDTVAVVAFDMAGGLGKRSSTGVVAGGENVYATTNTFYVSTTRWNARATTGSGRTDIHKFSSNEKSELSYRGSGSVPGSLLNSYAMSEFKGVLRVASTVQGRRGSIDRRSTSEGIVVTLEEKNGGLQEAGRVEGLGQEDSESILGVRFIEDKGYVVTFRQTDPLYVLDLRDVAKPKVAGELKIPGYSAYLHPVGKDLLLGVGRSGPESASPAADDLKTLRVPGPAEGAPVTSSRPAPVSGAQFSLFDVSDPANPKQVDVKTVPGVQALTESDPKAFLFWAQRNLIAVPVTRYSMSKDKPYSFGALFKVNGNTLEQSGEVAPKLAAQTAKSPSNEPGPPLGPEGSTYGSPYDNVRRNFVIGDHIYTLSTNGVSVHDLNSLRPTGSVTFASR